VEVIEVESRHELNAAVRARLIAEQLNPAADPRSARYDVDWVAPGRAQDV
jgi:hypothetical protein